MDDTVEGLQETTDNIAKYCGLGGLKMNAKKTEAMVIGKDASQHPLPQNRTMNLTVDGNPLETGHPVYLFGRHNYIGRQN